MKLDGAPNFRDLGGAATRDGATVRYHRVYRSENLSALTEDDLDRLQQADIHLVCDLRSHHEVETVRTRWPNGHEVEFLHLNVSGDMRSGDGNFGKLLLGNFTPEGARNTMLKSYARMAKRFEPRLELMFDRLAQAESLPAIVHCHVGKDRTGFACAMILAALDVPRDEILRDYLATATASDPARLRAAASSFIADMTGVTPPPEVVEPIVAVSEEYLDTAFQATAEQYGSVEDYLTKIGGLTPEKRDRLKALLLE
jgi:protein-tyrosine phosphatase